MSFLLILTFRFPNREASSEQSSVVVSLQLQKYKKNIYLFVAAKTALPKIVLKKLPGLGSETSKSIIKLIGSTKWLTIPMNATRPLFKFFYLAFKC